VLSYEVLTAFFLEAGFLGVALFGWNRLGQPALLRHDHGAIGTLISAFGFSPPIAGCRHRKASK